MTTQNDDDAVPAKQTRFSPWLVAAVGLAVVAIVGFVLAHYLSGDTTGPQSQDPIQNALAAGPDSITKDATVAEADGHGGMKILRRGTGDFTCMPGSEQMPPMCADKVAMQWNKDFLEHKPKPSTTTPGIEYMLEGATQRSDSDPNDTVSPPIKIGPHWMILWPFDPATSGLPTTHRDTGAYIMWAGTPFAHVHVMGRP